RREGEDEGVRSEGGRSERPDGRAREVRHGLHDGEVGCGFRRAARASTFSRSRAISRERPRNSRSMSSTSFCRLLPRCCGGLPERFMYPLLRALILMAPLLQPGAYMCRRVCQIDFVTHLSPAADLPSVAFTAGRRHRQRYDLEADDGVAGLQHEGAFARV